MQHRLLALVAIGIATVAGWGCRRAAAPLTVPQVTGRACEVALATGRADREVDRAIARLQERARQQTNARETLEQLGYAYVARARTTNDPGDYKLAETAAECLESVHPDNSVALLVRGHALHQMHRFREAEAIARRLVAMREFVLDYGLLGDALMEQGQIAEATTAYQRMIDLKPFYQSFTRAAHLRWLKGDVDGAVDLMRKAVDAASPRDRESVAWAYTRLSLYELQRGRATEASRSADAAMSFQPEYAAALLARGRVLLALNRPTDALDPLRRAAALNPLPEYQWALADTLRLCRLDTEAASVEQELTTRGAETDPRTLALFLATRSVNWSRALALTERELVARADVFTEDARAWALRAAGRLPEARAAMARALALNTQDARLFLHAGVIAATAGRQTEARRWLAKAEKFKTTLLPSELRELQRHQRRVRSRA